MSKKLKYDHGSDRLLTSWSNIGGSLLGTNRTIPSTDEEFQKIAESFRQYEIKVSEEQGRSFVC